MTNEPQTGTEIDPAALDAVIFDLDGVITDTAEVHLEAWIRMFNGFLEGRADGGVVSDLGELTIKGGDSSL